MKKISIIILACVLLLNLASCDGVKDPNQILPGELGEAFNSALAELSKGLQDLSAGVSYDSSDVLSQYVPDIPSQDDYSEDYSDDYSDDYSFYYPDNSEFDYSEYIGQFETEWPDDLLPAPDFGGVCSGMFSDAIGFYATYSNADINKVKSYAETLQSSGFNIEPYGYDYGELYSFSARRADGYEVSMALYLGTLSFACTKS